MSYRYRKLDVLFAPAEQQELATRDLTASVCVVFDILRATSAMVTALWNGAESIAPVSEIEEALAVRARDMEVLLAGERDGLRIGGAVTGGVEFEFGNSPAEFVAARVRGRRLVTTTTNGTRALMACRGASRVLVGSFLNLGSTVEALAGGDDLDLVLVCSGTGTRAALEDVLAAGALVERLRMGGEGIEGADSALMARDMYLGTRLDLEGGIGRSQNGRRLLGIPMLASDVAACARVDVCPLVAEMRDGLVRRVG